MKNPTGLTIKFSDDTGELATLEIDYTVGAPIITVTRDGKLGGKRTYEAVKQLLEDTCKNMDNAVLVPVNTTTGLTS